MSSPTITVIGLGYVGLCTAVSLASKGFSVSGYDVDKKKVERISAGRATFHEPQLDELLQLCLKKGFTSSDRLEASDICFITVGTPSLADGNIDLTYLRNAAAELGRSLKALDGYHLVVVKSTVVPGTTEAVVKPIVESISGRNFGTELGLVVNPEFLKEGSAITDTLKPDRLVVGEFDKKSGDFLVNFYKRFYGKDIPEVLRTNIVNAELIKYATNAFLATKVSFINMVANLCETIPNADVLVIAKGMGMDKRIGPLFLKAGAGWGGSCFPKDLRALKQLYKKLGVAPSLIDATIAINEGQPYRLASLAEGLVGELTGKRFAVLGLSFKPGTDDIREAVSLKVIRTLLERGARVVACDPVAVENAMKHFGGLPLLLKSHLSFAGSANECIKDADCCIVVTEWDDFRKLKPEDFIRNMKNPAVVDGRRVYDPKIFSSKLKFAAIGLASSVAPREIAELSPLNEAQGSR